MNSTEQARTAIPPTTVDPAYYRYLPVAMPLLVKSLCVTLCVVGFVVGTVGNILVLLAIVKTRKLRTTANSFLASLAVADFCMCVFMIPLLTVALISLEVVITNQLLCRLLYHIAFTCTPVSVQHLILIAINRYSLVNNRVTYVKFFNKLTIPIILAFVWSANVILNLSVALYAYGSRRFFGRDYCKFDQHNAFGAVYWLFTTLYTFVCSYVIIPTFYVLIFWTVRRSAKRVSQQPMTEEAASSALAIVSVPSTNTCQNRIARKFLSKSELKLTRVNFFIFLTNVLFLSPLFLILVIDRDLLTHGGFTMVMLPVCLNSATNPLVYCGFNRNFRQAFAKLVKLRC